MNLSISAYDIENGSAAHESIATSRAQALLGAAMHPIGRHEYLQRRRSALMDKIRALHFNPQQPKVFGVNFFA